ncbi:MAG: hypothetical protein KDD58_02435 [Bdellovibrionales bacterium]|nr:hypothetical protein [Bdellovibrionales bacterium]
MKLRFKFYILNNKGLGMMELMFAIALISGVTYAVLEMAQLQNQMLSNTRFISDIARLEKEVSGLLSTPGACQHEISDENLVVPTALKPEDVLSIINGRFINENIHFRLNIDNVQFENLNLSGANNYTSDLVFYISSKTNKTPIRPRKFPVLLQTDATNKVIGCNALTNSNTNQIDLVKMINKSEWITQIGQEICHEYGLEFIDGQCVIPEGKNSRPNSGEQYAYCYHSTPNFWVEGEAFKYDPSPDDNTNGDEYYIFNWDAATEDSSEKASGRWEVKTSINSMSDGLSNSFTHKVQGIQSHLYTTLKVDTSKDPEVMQIYVYDNFFVNNEDNNMNDALISCVGSFQ